MNNSFDDLDLYIRRGSDDEQSFALELVQEAADTRVGALSLAGYKDLEPTADAEAIVRYGRDLFERLFAPPLAEGFLEAWTRARTLKRKLRLRLIFDGLLPARIHAIPWEMICFDDSGGISPPRPLAIEEGIAFSRMLKNARPGEPVARRPLRMLIVISAPTDLADWELAEVNREAEQLGLESRFRKFKEAGQLAYDILPVASPEALQIALTTPDADGRGYDILLYYGHAVHHSEEGSRLVLQEATSREAVLYDGTLLVLLLRSLDALRPKLVLLIACNSATNTAGPSLNSLASRLMIQSRVPAVLAMQRLVEIGLARTFTYYLGENLLRDGVIDVAVNIARRTVYDAGDPGWSTPVLYMRLADGRLFTPNAALEYVQAIYSDREFARWQGNEYIPVGAINLAPGQDWRLLRYRPEDAPPASNAIEALKEAIGVLPSPVKTGSKGGSRPTNLCALIGPPHSGQTTTLQRLALELAEEVRKDPTRPLGIYISLAGYEQQHAGERLERHIIAQAGRAAAPLGAALAELFNLNAPDLYSELPHYVFLLDELDEVPPGMQIECSHELVALAGRFPMQQFVLTCWQEIFPAQILSNARILQIQPLSERQVAAYLRARAPGRDIQLMSRIRDNRLLALTTDPNLLVRVYERLIADPSAQLTRNQLVQDYLDRALSNVGARYMLGDAARRTLAALAWYARWNNIENIPVAELYREMARVRGERDYNLEELYLLLVDAGLINSVGHYAVRFVHPALHTFCTALALEHMPAAEAHECLQNVITMCGDPNRLSWWEDTLYAIAGMISNPTPLFEALAFAVRAGSGVHALLIARCLEALPAGQEGRLSNMLRQELIDHCVQRLSAEREPSGERREQIVTALGRLNDPQVISELKRLLVEKVRQSSSGDLRYEYTNVRIAAARSLRTIVLEHYSPLPSPIGQQIDSLAQQLQQRATMARIAGPTVVTDQLKPAEEEMLLNLLQTWQRGPDGRDALRNILLNSAHPPERAIACFALGDLVYPPLDPQSGQPDPFQLKLDDARLLMRCIVEPPLDEGKLRAGWEDTMWAAADALTLFDPDMVTGLLNNELGDLQRDLHYSSAQQLAYLAGRVRAATAEVIEWLRRTLISNPNPWVKSKALTALAWMGIDARNNSFSPADHTMTLKELVELIADGRRVKRTMYGLYKLSQRAADQQARTYLRRKAIEALAWIGDEETIDRLGQQVYSWPIALREHWYNSAASIRERLNDGLTV